MNIFFVFFLLLTTSGNLLLSRAQRSRRMRTTVTTPEIDPENRRDYANQAIIGRVDSSGQAAINPRASDIISNQNRLQNDRVRNEFTAGLTTHDLNIFDRGGSVPVINCSVSCTPRDVLKELRLETTKLDILKKLKINSLPNMTNHRLPDIPIVRRLVDRNHQQNDSPFVDDEDEDDDDDDQITFVDDHLEHSTTLRTIIFPSIYPMASVENRLNNSYCYFAFQPRIINSEILNATFGVYIRRREGSRQIIHPAPSPTVYLYRARRVGPSQLYMKKRVLWFSSAPGHWIQFNVRSLVQDWFNDPESNHGFEVQLEDYQGNFQSVINTVTEQDEPYKSYLDLKIRERERKLRSKRMQMMTCEEGSSERRCCRYPLIIDFEVFGWDWIIAPKSYQAYYCSGECPFTFYQTHQHTHVSQQSRVADLKNGEPCCSPKDFSAISLLYFNEHKNIVNSIIPGMIVNRCTCV